MEKTIKISEKNWSFLVALMDKINTQDNRATASPYYFVVRTKREVAVLPGSTGVERYYYEGNSFTEEDLRRFCDENELSFADVKEQANQYDVMEIDEFHNFFLTKDGYDQHIKLNGHNYKDPHSYVMYAGRNPELMQLLDTLGEITGKGYIRR